MNAAQCAVVCGSDADCAGSGQCVLLTGGVSACATNPDGPPGASPPPNGGCYNLGGAFGDVVANGGYRCTPTTGQDAVLTMDRCVDGTWMSMVYDCACQVTSSISGSLDPSSCTDFEVPNAARCEYALDFCAQCDPSGGCQSH